MCSPGHRALGPRPPRSVLRARALGGRVFRGVSCRMAGAGSGPRSPAAAAGLPAPGACPCRPLASPRSGPFVAEPQPHRGWRALAVAPSVCVRPSKTVTSRLGPVQPKRSGRHPRPEAAGPRVGATTSRARARSPPRRAAPHLPRVLEMGGLGRITGDLSSVYISKTAHLLRSLRVMGMDYG